MKARGVAPLLAALLLTGLAALLWLRRSGPAEPASEPVRPAVGSPATSAAHLPVAASGSDARTPRPAAPPPAASAPPMPSRRFTHRETASWYTEPSAKKLRADIWKRYETFAREARLDDATWQRFLGDLFDLAGGYEEAHAGRVRIPIADLDSYDDELDRELDDRLAAYLTPEQIALFHRDFLGWEAVSLVATAQLLEPADAPAP